jgi:DNA transformation protein
MPVSKSYREYVLEQLAGAGPVSARNMFGGVGIYTAGLFFAIIADDTLYFKVDDYNRSDYEAVGMGPFKPFGEKSYAMQYYEVPIDVLEDRERLAKWVKKALSAAKWKSSAAKKK